jgi:putative membrane protein
MLNLLLDWILTAVGLLAVAHLVPGFEVDSFGAALVAAIAVGLVNATIGIILKILTFPLTIVTLGIFWFVINALMLRLAAYFVPGFTIRGFLPAFLGALVLSVINVLKRVIIKALQDKPDQRSV